MIDRLERRRLSGTRAMSLPSTAMLLKSGAPRAASRSAARSRASCSEADRARSGGPPVLPAPAPAASAVLAAASTSRNSATLSKKPQSTQQE